MKVVTTELELIVNGKYQVNLRLQKYSLFTSKNFNKVVFAIEHNLCFGLAGPYTKLLFYKDFSIGNETGGMTAQRW